MSQLIQLKLLRVLQEKEIERVGESTNPRKIDVRVIASTNRDLKSAINRGEFRKDLYYRLNVMEIKIPALRERYEDVPLLISHFCKLFGATYKKDIDGVSNEVLETFMQYPWPGNVRELEHAIERAFVLCRNRVIELEHIPSEIRDNVRGEKGTLTKKSGDNPEELIKILEKTDWNISKAARMLGISRWTMYRRFRKFQIGRPGEKV